MEEAKKITSGIVGLIALYVGISLTGIYYMLEIAVFPIIAIPCIVYFIRHTLDLKEHVAFQLCVTLGIYIVTGNIVCIAIYLMSVFIPAIIVSTLYKRGNSLPNTVMATTVIFSIAVFGFFMIMKQIGIDFEEQYREGLNQIKKIYISEIDKLLLNQGNIITPDIISQISEVKTLIPDLIEAMKTVYSATILMLIMTSAGIITIISSSIARIKNKRLPSVKQFLEFRLSKVTILILLISVIVVTSGNNDIWSILGLNMMWFLSNIFQIVGVLAAIGLVTRIKSSTGLKILAYTMVFILVVCFSEMMMTFGCLDTLFNYRKTKIVV